MAEKREYFTNRDKEVLVSLIEEFKEVVENKKTDAVLLKKKETTWDKITEQFNSASGAKRQKKQLKNCWHNMKNRSKKKYGELRRHQFRTGGDAPIKDAEPLLEKTHSMYGYSLRTF